MTNQGFMGVYVTDHFLAESGDFMESLWLDGNFAVMTRPQMRCKVLVNDL